MKTNATALFTKRIPFKIVPGLVTAGCYSGFARSLTLVSSNGQAIVETTSHQTSALTLNNSKDCFQFYPTPSTCCSIAAGRLATDQHASRDVIFLGSRTNLVAYDVHNNMDIFYKELPDGANVLHVGRHVRVKDQPVVLVGGTCSLMALNQSGTEIFWTVTGDSVTSLATIDPDSEAEERECLLVIGSQDGRIRIMHNENILNEITESDAVVQLISINDGYFGFGLENGTIGVYNRCNRIWRIKSKCKPVCFAAYDINQDGCPELICGWNNGKIDGRLRSTGVVVFKAQMDAPIAGMVVMDYGGLPNILLVCSVDGEIRGYNAVNQETGADSTTATDTLLRQLTLKKQVLLSEQRDLTMSLRADRLTTQDIREATLSTIPADTELKVALGINSAEGCVNLSVSTSNAIKLRCVLLFAEGLFPGESHVIHLPEKQDYPSDCLLQLRPPRDSAIDVVIKGYAVPSVKGSAQQVFHVLQTAVRLPEFAMYRLISENTEVRWPGNLAKPYAGVTFSVLERPQRLATWINEHFLIPHQLHVAENQSLSVGFEGLRVDLPNEAVSFDADPSSGPPSRPVILIQMTVKGEISIRTEYIEIAANMVQSIARYLNLNQLSSTCDFPVAFEQLKSLIDLSEAHRVTRQQMLTDLAEKKEFIRDLIVTAEDHRLTGNWHDAKQAFMELYHENRQLLTTYQSRTREHELLTDFQKRINLIIEQASSLRTGKYKTRVISLCRQAMKNGNHGSLARIIRSGAE